MSLSRRLEDDLRAALRAGEDTRKRTIRMLISSLKNQQIENRAPLDTQQELSVVEKEIRIRRESAEGFQKADRPELVQQALEELEVLEGYMPAQLSDEELREVVRSVIQSTGASSQRDMGKVIPLVRAQVQGAAEGARISATVRDLLQAEGSR